MTTRDLIGMAIAGGYLFLFLLVGVTAAFCLRRAVSSRARRFAKRTAIFTGVFLLVSLVGIFLLFQQVRGTEAEFGVLALTVLTLPVAVEFPLLLAVLRWGPRPELAAECACA
jgi:hypothetical protein